MKLLNLTKRIRDLMEITKLYTVFDVYDGEDAAIESFLHAEWPKNRPSVSTAENLFCIGPIEPLLGGGAYAGFSRRRPWFCSFNQR